VAIRPGVFVLNCFACAVGRTEASSYLASFFEWNRRLARMVSLQMKIF
jgi:hypothetical protein